MESIEIFIDAFLKEYVYVYCDDEFVLDNWLQTRDPKWCELKTPGVFYTKWDAEHHMDLSGALVLKSTPTGPQGIKHANEVLDWTKYSNLPGLKYNTHCCDLPITNNFGSIGFRERFRERTLDFFKRQLLLGHQKTPRRPKKRSIAKSSKTRNLDVELQKSVSKIMDMMNVYVSNLRIENLV
jgi:hypothetical protein